MAKNFIILVLMSLLFVHLQAQDNFNLFNQGGSGCTFKSTASGNRLPAAASTDLKSCCCVGGRQPASVVEEFSDAKMCCCAGDRKPASTEEFIPQNMCCCQGQ